MPWISCGQAQFIIRLFKVLLNGESFLMGICFFISMLKNSKNIIEFLLKVHLIWQSQFFSYPFRDSLLIKTVQHDTTIWNFGCLDCIFLSTQIKDELHEILSPTDTMPYYKLWPHYDWNNLSKRVVNLYLTLLWFLLTISF